jgi:dolichol-phosphate mannosyltransferase
MTRVLVVLPTFNEALNLPLLIPEILAAVADADVLVVDDGSPDGTAAIADGLAGRSDGRVSVLRRTHKSGRGSAVLAGFEHGLADSRYTHFCEMDADLSHQPDEIADMLACAIAGADLVIGSRYMAGAPQIEGWSTPRRIWSRASNELIKAVLRLPMTDFTNGLRVYSRRAVEHLAVENLRETGFVALSEWAFFLHREGMPIAENPSRFVNRRLGKSNMSTAEAIGAARALVRLSRNRPGTGARNGA